MVRFVLSALPCGYVPGICNCEIAKEVVHAVPIIKLDYKINPSSVMYVSIIYDGTTRVNICIQMSSTGRNLFSPRMDHEM